MNIANTTQKILTMNDVDAFGNRLCFNAAANIIINMFAIFMVLKYSTKAMSPYKYFILMSIMGAFIMDFHSSVIFGMFAFFPLPLVCSAGLMRHAGWFWGAVFQWASMHVSFAIGGMSVFYGFVYQYCSINGNAEIFHKPKIVIAMFTSMFIYPLPTILIWIWNVNWEEGRVNLEQNAPYAYNLYLEGSCAINPFNYKGMIYVLSMLIQIMFLYGTAGILGIKIIRKLKEMKSSMSTNSLKARKQYLWILMIQMAVPGIFLVLPIMGISVSVIFSSSVGGDFSNGILQFFGLHSCGNAITVIIGLKPYREAIYKWINTLKRIILRRQAVAAPHSLTITSFSATSSNGVVK